MCWTSQMGPGSHWLNGGLFFNYARVSRAFFLGPPHEHIRQECWNCVETAFRKNRTSAWRKYPQIDSDITSPEAIHAQYNRATYVRRAWHLHQTQQTGPAPRGPRWADALRWTKTACTIHPKETGVLLQEISKRFHCWCDSQKLHNEPEDD